MGQHHHSDKAARKAKYERQKTRTELNKAKHINKMKALNPNWPNKKETDNVATEL